MRKILIMALAICLLPAVSYASTIVYAANDMALGELAGQRYTCFIIYMPRFDALVPIDVDSGELCGGVIMRDGSAYGFYAHAIQSWEGVAYFKTGNHVRIINGTPMYEIPSYPVARDDVEGFFPVPTPMKFTHWKIGRKENTGELFLQPK